MAESGDGERSSSENPSTQEFVPPSVKSGDATVRMDAKRGAMPPTQKTLPAWKDEAETPPQVAGYEILGVIGRGGMGVVYKARHVGLNRIVALKMILAGGHASARDRARFRTEAEAVARLTHPNIVQIHDIGEADGNPFFSLEFVEGGSLAERLDGTPQPAKVAASMVETLANAVHAAHQHGIVHRDLKPANILLARSVDPTSSVPKITDFGLAKKLDDESGQTHSGAIIGTPSYMAPEQAGGEVQRVGPTTDVYALGAILYELLTGRPPFKGQTPVDTVLQVIDEDPLPPTRLNPRVPRDLETICLKCLQKAPAKRYATADALAADLRRFQNGEPILARPVSTMERTAKWVRRRPAVAILSALLVIVLAAAFVWIYLALERERQLRFLSDFNAQAADNKAKHAETAEKEMRAQLRNTLFAQAQRGRWSGRVGRRFESLSALAKAAAIQPSLALRNEAIACMALADVRVAKEWDGAAIDGNTLAFDRAYERYARGDARGNVSIRRVDDDAEIVHLPGPGYLSWEALFDPTGKYLAVAYYEEHKPQIVTLWDLADGKKIFTRPYGRLDFNPDGTRMTMVFTAGYPNGTVLNFDIPGGGKETKYTGPYSPHQVRYSPDGKRLAVAGTGGAQIFEVATGARLGLLPNTGAGVGLAWHPDGVLLAVGGADSNVHIWNVDTKAKYAVLSGHKHMVTHVQFSHQGDFLTSESWDGFMRFWDVRGKKQLFTVSEFAGVPQRFTHERFLGVRKAGTKIKLMELAPGKECRSLIDLPRHPRYWNASVHPGNRLLASPQLNGAALWDLYTGKKVGLLPSGIVISAAFHPDGKQLIASGNSGIFRWPIEHEPETGAATFGPPEPLSFGAVSHITDLSPDGKFLSLHLPKEAGIVDLQTRKRTLSLLHANLNYVNFSPDGRWIATGTWHGKNINVWHADSGELARTLPINQTAAPLFSPDSKWIVSRGRHFEFWRVGSWEMTHRIQREQDTDVPGGAAFTRDGKILAMTISPLAIRLIDMETKTELATLEAPEDSLFGELTFSPDDRFLIRTDENLTNQVWDLALIRRQLAEMRLDWGATPPPPIADAGASVVVKVNAGNLSGLGAPALTPEEKWDRIMLLRWAALKKNPKSADANNNVAWSYVAGPESRRDPNKALPYARKAVELEPKVYTYSNTLGLALYRTKNYSEAIMVLEKLVRENEKLAFLAYDHCFLAMCHHQLGDRDKARENYRQSLKIYQANTNKFAPDQRDEVDMFLAEAAALIQP